MRKPTFCICENKDADQLRGNSAFVIAIRILQSLYYLNPKFQASYRLLSQPGLCQTWSETPKTGFLTTRLICTSSGMQTYTLKFYKFHNQIRSFNLFVSVITLIPKSFESPNEKFDQAQHKPGCTCNCRKWLEA